MNIAKRTQSIIFVVIGLICVAFALLYYIQRSLLVEESTRLTFGSGEVAITPLAEDIASSSEQTSLEQSQTNSRFLYPTFISIREIGIEVPVTVVGLTENNFVTTPPDKAGFWQSSADLRRIGNSVIVGHNKSEPLPIFRDLGAIRPGMEIVLTSQTGAEYLYIVKEVEIIQVAGAPRDQIARVAELMKLETSFQRLTVVACHPAESCEQRIVVLAEP